MKLLESSSDRLAAAAKKNALPDSVVQNRYPSSSAAPRLAASLVFERIS